ncbi:MAG: alpha/beta fold hydrolase [Actinomycetia bacterium]|nr:alpha/beta fold hydrolase [Actinomycetes bacterium]
METGAVDHAEEAALARLIQDASAVLGRVESYGPHPDQVIEWFDPLGSRRAPVVLVHGGYFRPQIDRTHAKVTAAALSAALDAPVVLPEYRREPGAPDLAVADLAAVSDLLEGLDEVPPAWVGHSAGGTLALIRALDQVRTRTQVIALAPIVDLRRGLASGLGDGAIKDWLGERTARKRSRYAHLDPAVLLADLPERSDSIVCVHGDLDATVPLAQPRESGLRMIVLDGAHHIDLIDPGSTYWPAVVQVVADRIDAPD